MRHYLANIYHRSIIGLLLVCISLLTACQSQVVGSKMLHSSLKSSQPCGDLWRNNSVAQMNMAQYWIELIACSTQHMANTLPEQNPPNAPLTEKSWQYLFKQNLVLAYLNGSEAEQRQMWEKLMQVRNEIPNTLGGIVDLWLAKQYQQFSLNSEKSKNQRLKDLINEQSRTVATLRQDLQELQAKLKNITAIENQLLPARNGSTTRDAPSLVEQSDDNKTQVVITSPAQVTSLSDKAMMDKSFAKAERIKNEESD